jgi:uncharacterized protein (DUF3084 family)
MSADDLLTQLHDLVMKTLEEGRKTSYSLEEREGLNKKAEEVRQRLVLLRQAQFDHNTQGYQESSQAMGKVNEQLSQAQARIDDLVTFFENMDKLAEALDTLLKAAIPS